MRIPEVASSHGWFSIASRQLHTRSNPLIHLGLDPAYRPRPERDRLRKLLAEVRCEAYQRSELEQLCRYVTRPAIANERLSVNRVARQDAFDEGGGT